VLELGDDDTREDHGDPHDDGADVEHGFTADFVNNGHRGEGRDEKDDARDTSGEKCLSSAGQSETFKDVTGVVNDGIDTRPILISSSSIERRKV
jgi:hypothetical protein